MQFTVEQISVMRKAGLRTSNQTDAPDPTLYSRGAVRDFRSKGFVAKYWNFVDQYRHLPNLHEYVRCIRCNAKANRDGISRPRRVFGLHSSKLVSAQKYRHSNCPAAGGKDVTYNAKHPDVMARLPAFLAAQLSITFTHSGAMDDDMLQHIHHDVMKGLSFQAACDRAASFLRHNHNQAELCSCLEASDQMTPLATFHDKNRVLHAALQCKNRRGVAKTMTVLLVHANFFVFSARLLHGCGLAAGT